MQLSWKNHKNLRLNQSFLSSEIYTVSCETLDDINILFSCAAIMEAKIDKKIAKINKKKFPILIEHTPLEGFIDRNLKTPMNVGKSIYVGKLFSVLTDEITKDGICIYCGEKKCTCNKEERNEILRKQERALQNQKLFEISGKTKKKTMGKSCKSKSKGHWSSKEDPKWSKDEATWGVEEPSFSDKEASFSVDEKKETKKTLVNKKTKSVWT